MILLIRTIFRIRIRTVIIIIIRQIITLILITNNNRNDTSINDIHDINDNAYAHEHDTDHDNDSTNKRNTYNTNIVKHHYAYY